ncbi:uncharacterized protein LOC111716337 [Eurytemora carolleeae]|uniref:uncharacterized protein LOC111716337 n=1 Tax=Eurytemora carolleeae TaxID=1294199 RepID=UPI000C766A3E|nr:uncharacterized protein LOC111716337 [Eurytemora carolleeae]|eukprot:XP_023347542.1 uncharacterized protein LOC111716337 [Eurytemora affinis]
MALVSSCICCSLLTAAIMSGIISTFMYALIFCLEVWWIIDAKVSLSVPAYILACGYFIMFVVSITMLLGLRTRRTRLLLCWLLVQVLYVFPEAGLVLFMSIYHWNGETFGIVELALWATRVIFNVFGIVSVQSLWSYWKDEKSVFRSLQELGNTNGGVVGGGVGENGLGIPGQLKLRGSLRYQSGGYSSSYPPDQLGFVNRYANQLGYANPAFSGSSAHIRGGLAVTKYGAQDSTQLSMKFH